MEVTSKDITKNHLIVEEDLVKGEVRVPKETSQNSDNPDSLNNEKFVERCVNQESLNAGCAENLSAPIVKETTLDVIVAEGEKRQKGSVVGENIAKLREVNVENVEINDKSGPELPTESDNVNVSLENIGDYLNDIVKKVVNDVVDEVSGEISIEEEFEKEINLDKDVALGTFLKRRTGSAKSKERRGQGKSTSALEKGPPITRRRATSQLYSASQGNKEKSPGKNSKLAKAVNLSRLIDEEEVVTVSDKEEEEEETEEEAPLERRNFKGKKRSVIDEEENVGKVEAEKVNEKIIKEKEVTPSPKKRKSPVNREAGPSKKRKVISTEGPGSSKKGK
ncbi:uncharacterized protein LOC132619649 [Lycium barbarum]|uniref:uncharacterized protein LOC132619649 n=1 Tax=Lycium barbarum TaxID=112863 RepID=UPI00293EF121|nr:uncharacterized protein LOC132619649 [Lycium barbarum]